MSPPLLSVENLTLDFRTREGTVKALEDVSLEVGRGEIVGVVGESGSGKSVTAYAVMGLLEASAVRRGGTIRFAGIDLTKGGRGALASVRGREMAMIFQSPRTALNPIRKVGRQIEDVLLRHGAVPRHDARIRAIAALKQVRIPDPARRYAAYPFELSGGMCQRVMIAMALACAPFLLIADEPTTGLDVTTQATVMDLIRERVEASGMGCLLITHDLGLAGEYCDRIVVMHAGHTVETAPTAALLRRAAHPYSSRLVAATPVAGSTVESLEAVGGNLPDLRASLPPCRFAGRCPRHEADCDSGPLRDAVLAPGHRVRCRHPA